MAYYTYDEFKKFIARGNVIDMAVGIIIGAAFGKIVDSFVKDIIMPPVGVLVGGIDFSQWFYVISGGEPGVHYNTMAAATAAGATTLNVGTFLNTIISFLITMFAVFIIVKVANSARAKGPVTTRACPYCQQSISKLATKCPYCCSTVKAEEIGAVEEAELTKGLKSLTAKVGKVAKAAKKVAKIK